MRQPGTEFQANPHDVAGSVGIEPMQIPAHFAKDHQKWANNTAVYR